MNDKKIKSMKERLRDMRRSNKCPSDAPKGQIERARGNIQRHNDRIFQN